MTIQTRVGQIIDGDNRFLGHSAFEHWSHHLTAPSDGLIAALGVPLTAHSREVFRLLSLCLTSPDPRVWPLKLTRLLSSHQDPLAGYFGAQLVSAGRVMGPGAATHAGRGLVFVAEHSAPSPTQAEVTTAVERWCAEPATRGRFGGFGVPFRPQDERRIGLLRLLQDSPLAEGRYWRLHLQVVAALAPLPPNCVISLTALLLDIGLHPERCGMAFSVCMAHIYLAHALESAQQDGARLHHLPVETVDYQGIPARCLSEPGPRTPVHPALRRGSRDPQP